MKSVLALAPIAGLALAPFSTPPSTAPAATWNTLVATTEAGDMIVYDAEGSVVDHFEVADVDGFGPVFATVGDLAAVRRIGEDAVTTVDLRDGTSTSYPLAAVSSVQFVRGSETMLFALSRLQDELTLIDLERGSTIDVRELWPTDERDDSPRVFSNQVSMSDSGVIAVSDYAYARTLLISPNAESTTVITSTLVGLLGDVVVTLADGSNGGELEFWNLDGTLQSKTSRIDALQVVDIVHGSLIAITEAGDLLTLTPDGPEPQPFGQVDVGDGDRDPIGLVEIAGGRLLVVAEGALHVVSAAGTVEQTMTDVGRASDVYRSLTPATRCVSTADVVLDTQSDARLPAAQPGVASADGCTYAVNDVADPNQIVRDTVTVPVPGRPVSISPDGSHAVVRLDDSGEFHLVDLGAPNELGDPLDIGDAAAAWFAFVEH